MVPKNPWNNRTAAFAIAVAFLVGLVGSLALRSYSSKTTASTVTVTERARIHWRVPVAFSTNLPALGDNILYVSDKLNRATNGRVELEVFEPGMLIPAFSITEGVRDKKIEAGYTWLGYDQGRIPATPLISAVPFGMEPWEFTAWYFEDEGRLLTEELYRKHNVHPVLCGVIGPETAGWFRDRIESLEDFDGLKIRFAGLGGRVLQKLGASVTMIPGGEIFQALEKGAIDATEFSLPAVDEMLGFDRVAKFNYFPGWHQTFTAEHLVVNLQTWQGLADSDQELIEMACTAGIIRNLSRGEGIQGEVMKGFPAKDVTPVRFSDEILRQLEALTNEVLAEEAAKDQDFARIWESQKKFIKTYQNWKSHAYLPRDF
ncbi:MAG TPA: TRAP transporter substrate-binding protein [Pseudomonadales bacterium]|jgi:TRAP-type mannitol/chloroaromatic compound transport system substrate-binding protein|nr:C4-dicarboxylate ABC transporter [Gammaproteobacteria bacterium]MDP6026884.1 TRAP transporter substrate-binding protein [Pseudomonadales bacterium]MDP6316387.1 TRAP transporter substrate-binding protein [Pseudomonadales bacterium]MDP7314977.1 TRAP transporter substrate-binding protein [Pseudomonadales bacterium]HJP49771.1 TRAP transporter substrate-binding protein [Pseudomonadales bacterium]|tara:strand:- start:1468 stop:2586 length:1119 start_codon:yes stop_codon:yes gene_type:complete